MGGWLPQSLRSRLLARAPRSRLRLWCDWPPKGACPTAAGQISLKGWALPRDEVAEVAVVCDDGRRFPAFYGLPRPDVRDAVRGAGDADELGWALRLDTREWEPGRHQITIIATDRRGRARSVRRVVDVDPLGRYRAWLADREGMLPTVEQAQQLAGAPQAAEFDVWVQAVAGARDAERTRRSLAAQSYPRWRRVPADDLPTALASFLAGDAEYLVLARAGDVVEPHALASIAERVAEAPRPDLVYADHDYLADERAHPFFKPAWSPELLLAIDYVGPFFALGRDAARAALDADAAPPQTGYEVLLRLIDRDVEVERIPDVLYSHGAVATPAEEELAALDALARRRGTNVSVTAAGYPGARRVTWPLTREPKVTVIIPSALKNGHLVRCLDSIRALTTYRNFEVVVVLNATVGEAPDLDLPGSGSRTLRYEGDFNYSAINNLAAREAQGDYLLFVNDDVQVESPDWVQTLVSVAAQPKVGIAGAKLLFPGGGLQVGGQLLTSDDHQARAIGLFMAETAHGYHGLLGVARNTSSVCGACMIVRKEVFGALDGFDEDLAVDLNDVDLCLRALAAGWRVVWTPEAVLRHYGRGSRRERLEPRDHDRFRHRWLDVLQAGDPYYNPNLEIGAESEFEIRQVADGIRRRGRVRVAPAARDLRAGERPSPERFDPATMNGLIAAEHEARYRWAAAVVAGRDVLDAGCGVGYGTKICADAGAARVVGVDVSDTALADAARRIRDVPRAEVRHADVCALPLATATFDVVLCFEAIEHIADPERALDELRRVLRPEGVLLISSPHRGVYPAGNPYHVHEYTPVELEAALRSRFANVRMHYQNVWLGSLISGADALAVASADRELEGSVRKVTPAAPGEEIYTLAVASDAPLPALGNIVVLTGGADLAALHARIDGLEQETHRAWKEAERWRRLATARHPHDARRTGAGTHRPVYDNR